MYRLLLLMPLLLIACQEGEEATLARAAGHQIGQQAGQFGAAFGEADMAPIKQGMIDNQPSWETVSPRSKEECLGETDGVLNETFLRCRNGWQEYVRVDSTGNRKVLQERPIPSHR